MNNNVCMYLGIIILLLSRKEEKNRKVTLPYTWWYRMQCVADHIICDTHFQFGRKYKISPLYYARKFEDG